MADAFDEPATGAIGGRRVAWTWRQRAEQYQAESAAECAFRDPSGSISPLLRRWRHGLAHLQPGLIMFQPYMALGMRIRRPWTDPIEIRVNAVSSDYRTTTGLEILYFQGRVFEIDTGQAVIEWGLGALLGDWVIDKVTPESA